MLAALYLYVTRFSFSVTEIKDKMVIGSAKKIRKSALISLLCCFWSPNVLTMTSSLPDLMKVL